jgi:hypothetical protein
MYIYMNLGQIVKVSYVSNDKSDIKSVKVRFLGWDGSFDEEIKREHLGGEIYIYIYICINEYMYVYIYVYI